MFSQLTDLSFVVVCNEENDLFQTLIANNIACERYSEAEQALAVCKEGGALLLLADGYPASQTPMQDEWLAIAARKKLRIYVEFPASLPGLGALPVRKADRLERGIVTSDQLGAGLPVGSIFTLPGAHHVLLPCGEPLLVLGKVAGFGLIAYELAETPTEPLLMRFGGSGASGESGVLVATAGLSHFLKARCAPVKIWRALFSSLVEWLSRGEISVELGWEPVVRPSFGKDEELPPAAIDSAITRAVDWFYRARLFPPAGCEALYHAEKADTRPMIADWPEGTGSEGVLEGLISAMDSEGKQRVRWWRRADCTGEVAGAMALAALAEGNAKWRDSAAQLADWLYFRSILSQGDRATPSHSAFGLLGWHDRTAHGIYADGWGIYYGDDNARAILGTIATAGALGVHRWDRSILRCILANFRTTGREGFRVDRIEGAALVEKGWRSYFDGDTRSFAPHFQAYPWACYLWAYSKTGDTRLLERTRRGIKSMMEAYPGQWHWTNGMQQERARMLLPLAWLVRVQDTAEHRGWLATIAGELLAHQESCGAIREEIGAKKGKYGPPVSHEAYGRSEAPLLQCNGDPVADLLYTMNFAFLGMHEAAIATGEARYLDAAARLEAFLLKAQGRSARPELEGAWFRAFDFEQWEFWGSDSDGDWGAWCVETGWSQAWIASVLAMRKMGTSLWELGNKTTIHEHQQESALMFE